MTTTSADPGRERLLRHQFAAEVLRARTVMLMAAGLWLVVGVTLDIIAFPHLGRGSLAVVLGCRLGASAFHALVIAVLFRRPLPSERLVNLLSALMFPITSVALTVMSARMGGLNSPYEPTFIVILTAQVLAVPLPWRRGLVVAFATAAVLPLGMLLLARFDPVSGPLLHAQAQGAAQQTAYAILLVSLFASVVLVVWSGHMMWSLRQSAFETKSIGRYRLLSRIGVGGMGEVWKARDKALRRDVALKILSSDHGRTPAGVARFEREIQAITELTHPNTVRIHDWGITGDGVWYYAMELLEGLDLGTLIKRHGPLPASVVVKLGGEAAHALAEAHAKRIVHRDIKPGNLFIVVVAGRIDFLKVLDFGVARVPGDDEHITQVGQIMGTPGFIAPEVLAGVTAGPAADIYGLGATLAFAVTGEKPVNHRPGKGPKPILPELEVVLMRALDPDPARRHKSALELADELVNCGIPASSSTVLTLEATASVALDVTLDQVKDSMATPKETPSVTGRGEAGSR